MKQNQKRAPGNRAIDKLQCPSGRKTIPPEPLQSLDTDPFGSYTGNPIDNEVPVQDADDL